jgi:hypothetical protein
MVRIFRIKYTIVRLLPEPPLPAWERGTREFFIFFSPSPIRGEGGVRAQDPNNPSIQK